MTCESDTDPLVLLNDPRNDFNKVNFQFFQILDTLFSTSPFIFDTIDLVTHKLLLIIIKNMI